MPCPAAMFFGWASRHWGDLKAAQPSSLSMSLFVPQVRQKITTKHAQMDMFMISSQVHVRFALMSQWRPKILQLLLMITYDLVSSHIPVLSISVQFSFASSLVAQSPLWRMRNSQDLKHQENWKKFSHFQPQGVFNEKCLRIFVTRNSK